MRRQGGWEIIATRLKTKFSNNIRNNFGFLNRAAPEGVGQPDKLFVQEGRKVFKEVVPMVSELIVEHAAELGLAPRKLKRLWLHQANINMNELIARRVLGRDPTREETPTSSTNMPIRAPQARSSPSTSTPTIWRRRYGPDLHLRRGLFRRTVFVRKR